MVTKKKQPPTMRDKFTGASLDGWLEAGRSIPLDTWQDAQQAADAMNERVKFVIEEPLTGAKLGEFSVPSYKRVEVRLAWGGAPRGMRILESEIKVGGIVRMTGHREFRSTTREQLKKDIEELVKGGVEEAGEVYASSSSYITTPSIDEIVRSAPSDVVG